MAYKKMALPLCKQCGEQHVNTHVCEPRRLAREAAARVTATEDERLERNRNTLPPVEPGAAGAGWSPWGDRLRTMTNHGGALAQIRPNRPGGVRVPDSWRED